MVYLQYMKNKYSHSYIQKGLAFRLAYYFPSGAADDGGRNHTMWNLGYGSVQVNLFFARSSPFLLTSMGTPLLPANVRSETMGFPQNSGYSSPNNVLILGVQ